MMGKRIAPALGKALLIILALNIFQFLLSFFIPLLFNQPAEEGTVLALNFLFGLSVIPVVLFCFLFKDHLMNGIVWTLTFIIYYILLGIGNGNVELLFSTFLIYVLIISPLIVNIAIFLHIKRQKGEEALIK